MKTFKEFINESAAPKTFVINTQASLDDEYAEAILKSLAKNGVEVSASDFKKGSSELFISVTKGSKAKIKSAFGVARTDQIDNHDFKQTGVKRQNTIASRGIK
ncbi:internal head protein [Salmonella phage KM16]|uniref:internal head protein n=1 Tax=Salmonella phage KM16 TaxID=2797303 RepID=UPI00248FDBFC|nr:internal head protein [Salmonella phage KM16]